MRTSGLATALTATLLLVGCSAQPSSQPQPPRESPVVEPAPAPSVDSTVATGVIFGDRIEWRNATGGVVDSVGYNVDASVFRSNLEEHLGLPDKTEEVCASYAYGAALSIYDRDPGAILVSVTAADANGVRLETSTGHSVGDDATDLFHATPADLRRDLSAISDSFPYWMVIYDQTTTVSEGHPEPVPYGAGALLKDMTIVSIEGQTPLGLPDGSFC